MALQFILGRAGTGKSRYCVESLLEELRENPTGSSLILLVPEQASFQTDSALLDSGELQAFFRAQVLSFRRLAYRVLLETGGLCLPSLTPRGKQMILRALVTENADSLGIFSRLADRPGFIESLSAVLSELHQFGVDPQAIKSLDHNMLPNYPLQRKLSDVSVIMEALDQAAENRFTDPDHFLDLVIPKISGCDLLRDAHIWVDGFSGFTPQEYKVLAELMKTARTVEIALCLDGRDSTLPADGRSDSPSTPETDGRLFLQTEETFCTLKKLASAASVPVGQVHMLDDTEMPPARFLGTPDLAHLEREFFRFPPASYEGEVQDVRLVEAESPRQEIDVLAREIRNLCQNKGMRYREIGVIVRNLSEYESYIEAIFSEHGIPAFLDRRRSVAHHPLVELIRSAVNVVLTNWAPGPVFQYLKTDFLGTVNRDSAGEHLWEVTEQVTPIPREKIDLLENYVLAHGIRSRRWLQEEPWDFRSGVFQKEEDLEDLPTGEGRETSEDIRLADINRWRFRATEALREFHVRIADLKGDEETILVQRFTECLYVLLDTLKVENTLERWAKELESTVRERTDISSDPREMASEHRQVWKAVIDVFDDLVEILGDQKYRLEEIAEVLEVGLAGLDIGLTPPKVDQVLVGSVERSRQPDLKAAFVLGLNEGQFPRVVSPDSIFSDDDREALKSIGIALRPSSVQQLHNENYLGYIAFTRAREFLQLSYSVADENGKTRTPSHFVKQLKRCFPQLEVVSPSRDAPAIASVATPLRLMEALCVNLRHGTDNRWLDIYDAVVQDTRLTDLSRKTLPSLVYDNGARLGSQIIHRALGDRLATSVSRLESFGACPFQHFGRYLLQLKEREHYRLTPMDLGSYYHEALNDFVQAFKDLRNLESKEISEELGRVLKSLANRFRHDILRSSSRNEFVAGTVERSLNDMLTAQVRAARVSDFLPYETEVNFGIAQRPGLSLGLSKGRELILRGRIDRVDVAEVDGRKVARVIDYKLGSNKRLDLGEVFLGLRLQLLTYLLAIRKLSSRLLNQEMEVAGCVYVPIQPKISTDEDWDNVPGPDEDRYYAPYKAHGVFSDTYAESMERVEPGSTGNFHSICKNKDGTFGRLATTDVVQEDNLLALIDLVEEKVKYLAEGILDGRIEVSPYRIAGTRACQFCEMAAVCRFDPAIQHYRSEKKLRKTEVLALLKGMGENNG